MQSDPTLTSTDTKAHREGVLNQLLVLLNKAVHEGKKSKDEGVPGSGGGEGREAGAGGSGVDLTQALKDITRAGDEGEATGTESAIEKEAIDYLHGSLGLVPMSDD